MSGRARVVKARREGGILQLTRLVPPPPRCAWSLPAGPPVLRTVPAFAGLSSCHWHDEFASRTGCSPPAAQGRICGGDVEPLSTMRGAILPWKAEEWGSSSARPFEAGAADRGSNLSIGGSLMGSACLAGRDSDLHRPRRRSTSIEKVRRCRGSCPAKRGRGTAEGGGGGGALYIQAGLAGPV